MAAVGATVFLRVPTEDGTSVYEGRIVKKKGNRNYLVAISDDAGGADVVEVTRAGIRFKVADGVQVVGFPSDVDASKLPTDTEGVVSSTWEDPSSQAIGAIGKAVGQLAARLDALETPQAASSSRSRAPVARKAKGAQANGLESLLGNYPGPRVGAADDDGESGADSETSSGDSSSASGEDFTFGLGKPGRGTKSSEGDSKKLKKKSKDKETAADGGDTKTIMKEFTKAMKALTKRKGDSGSSSGSSHRGKYSYPRRLRHRVYRRPERLVNAWLRHVKKDLRGGQAGNPWSLSLHAEKLRRSFGNNVGLYRCHFLLSQALDVILLEKKTLAGIALLICALQAIHQAALHNGRWGLAMELTPVPDPLATVTYAGDPEHLDEAIQFHEAVGKVNEKSGVKKEDGKNEEKTPKK